MASLTMTHMHPVKMIWPAMLLAPFSSLHYVRSASEHKLVGYNEADVSCNLEGKKSTTGVLFCLNNTCHGDIVQMGGLKRIASINMNNQLAIQLCKNPVFHRGSIFIETCFNFLMEGVGGMVIHHVVC